MTHGRARWVGGVTWYSMGSLLRIYIVKFTSNSHKPNSFQVIAESDFSRKTKKKLLWDNAMSFLNLDHTKF